MDHQKNSRKKSCDCEKNCYCWIYYCANCNIVVDKELDFCSEKCQIHYHQKREQERIDSMNLLQQKWREYLARKSKQE